MLQELNKEMLSKLAPSVFTTNAHTSTSNKYQHISTLQIIEGLAKEGFIPTWAGQSNTRMDEKKMFAKHLIRFRHCDISPQKRSLYPELVLVNSHDGLSSYRLHAGLFRLVCSNGLVAGTTYDEVRIRHQGNILDNVIEGTFSIVDNANKMLEAAKEMAVIKLNTQEKQYLAEAAHAVKFEEGTNQAIAIKPESLLRVRRAIDNESDLFTTFNVIQENIIKGGTSGYVRQNGRVRRVSTRPVQSIDQNIKLNKALWSLAEKMLQLKSA